MGPNSEPDPSPYPRTTSSQFCRNKIIQIEDDVIVKQVYHSQFTQHPNGIITIGKLYLSFISGKTLESVWSRLSMSDKERLCRDTWVLIDKLRLIPRPQQEGNVENQGEGTKLFYCAADGTSNIIHPLVGGMWEPSPPLHDDEALRSQTWKRYVEFKGLSYPDGQSVRDLVPHSDKAVFTHGDIHPGNILVDEKKEDDGSSGQVQIVGLIDFESAGFLPDYWEYAQVMKFAFLRDDYVEDEGQWMVVMERMAPKKWNFRGIHKARRVLF